MKKRIDQLLPGAARNAQRPTRPRRRLRPQAHVALMKIAKLIHHPDCDGAEDIDLCQCQPLTRKALRRLPAYFHCGICEHGHPLGFAGDCRDDDNRFTIFEMERAHGPNGFHLMELEDQL